MKRRYHHKFNRHWQDLQMSHQANKKVLECHSSCDNEWRTKGAHFHVRGDKILRDFLALLGKNFAQRNNGAHIIIKIKRWFTKRREGKRLIIKTTCISPSYICQFYAKHLFNLWYWFPKLLHWHWTWIVSVIRYTFWKYKKRKLSPQLLQFLPWINLKISSPILWFILKPHNTVAAVGQKHIHQF